METKDIIILAAVFAFAGFSLYRKYKQKSAGEGKQGTGTDSGTASFSDDDNYEPYSDRKK
jgi:hypothetical protein